MRKLYLNGQNYTDDVVGLENFKLDLTFNDDLILEYSTSSNLLFKGKGFQLVKDYWFGENNYCELGRVPIKGYIEDTECSFRIEMEIRIGSVQICFEECEARVTLVQVQTEEAAYLCLKNAINFYSPLGFYDFIKTRSKKIPYCKTLNVFNFLIWHFALRPIIGGLAGLLCPFINFFGGDCDDYVKEVSRKAIDCNNYITAALLRDIFEWNCERCGVRFSSSILQQNPYSELALLYQNGNIGPELDESENPDAQFRSEDQLNRNVLQLWDMLKPVFNSKVRMKNGLAELERKDYFEKYTKVIMNIEDEYRSGNMECPEYVHNTQELYAYGRFQYTSDASDKSGEKMKDEFNDIIEWNPNKYLEVKGEYTNTVPFAPHNYVGNKMASWVNERESYAVGCNLKYWLEIGEQEFFTPKIVLVSESKIRCEHRLYNIAKFEEKLLSPGSKYRDYNNEMKFKDIDKNATDLYNRFHIIDSPEYGRKLIELKPFTWYPINFKDTVNDILTIGLDVAISTRYGTTKPERISIDFETKGITITPIKIRCK